MKKLIYIFLIFCSCGSISEENVKPNNLIPEDKMIDILYDMSLISVSKGINKRILENNGMKPKKYILKNTILIAFNLLLVMSIILKI